MTLGSDATLFGKDTLLAHESSSQHDANERMDNRFEKLDFGVRKDIVRVDSDSIFSSDMDATTPCTPGKLKWTFSIPSLLTYGTPAITKNGMIVIGSEIGKLYSITPAGIKNWEYTAGAQILSSPVIAPDGTIYVAAYGTLHAVTAAGAAKWTFKAIGILSSPAVNDDGTVYLAAKQNLLAIKPDGTQKWGFPVSGATPPIVGTDGTVYFGAGKTLYVLFSDGSKKWEFASGGSLGYPPTMAPNGPIYIISGNEFAAGGDRRVYSIDINGKKLWEYSPYYPPVSATNGVPTPIIGQGGVVYVGNSQAITAILPGGTKSWEYSTGNHCSSAAIGANGTIYIACGGQLFAITSSGTFLWKILLPYCVNSSPTISQSGTLYIGGSKLYAVDTCNPGGLSTSSTSAWPKYNHDISNSGKAI